MESMSFICNRITKLKRKIATIDEVRKPRNIALESLFSDIIVYSHHDRPLVHKTKATGKMGLRVDTDYRALGSNLVPQFCRWHCIVVFPGQSNSNSVLSCLLFNGPGNTVTERPLVNEIVPIKAMRD